MGKFARVCLKTPYIDYNGRLCMVSAAAGEQEGVRHRPRRRTRGRTSRRRRGDLDQRGRTSPSAPRSPPTTSGRPARTAPRSSSSTRASRRSPAPATCSCRSSPGRDAALFNGILHLMIENDWLDHDFIANAHGRLRAGGRARAASGRRRETAEVTGIAERAIRQAAEWWGTAQDQLPDARPRHRAPHPRRAERARRDQHRAGLRAHRPARLRLRHDHRPGQRPGRARARPEVRPAARRARHRQPRAPRVHRRGLGHRRAGPARPGRRLPTRSSARSTPARSRAAVASASTRWCRCPTTSSSRAMLEKLEFYVAIDFFLSETARYADVVLPGLPARGGRGRRHPGRGAGHQDQQGRRPARATRGRTGASSRTSPQALGRPQGFTFASPREIFEELRVASKGGVADYSGITYEKIERADGRLLAVLATTRGPASPRRSPRHAAAVRAGLLEPGRQGHGPFYFPDGKARFHVADYAPPAEDVDAEYPIILTTGRVVSQFLSGTQTRRIGPLVDQYPEPRIELHPRLAEQARHRRRRLGDGRVAARRDHPARAGGHDHPAGHGLRPVPLGRARRASTS